VVLSRLNEKDRHGAGPSVYFLAAFFLPATVRWGPCGCARSFSFAGAHGQSAAVTQAALAADVGEALDVTGNLAAQVAFDFIRVDRFAQLVFVFAREVFHPYVGADARLRKQLLRRRKTDAEDVVRAISMRLSRGRSMPKYAPLVTPTCLCLG